MTNKKKGGPKAGNATMWINVHKTEEDTAPHYRGKMDVDGVRYELSLWVDGYALGSNIPIKMSGQISLPAEEGT